MVVDRLDSTSEWASLMDGIATGFGMVAARSFGDDPLADRLLDTWNALHGPATWDETAQVWTHTALVLPRTYQNSFHLLMLSSGTQDPLGLEDAPWDPELPHLAAISDPGVFVNQAVWDADSAQLILTLNGGGAVDGSVDLSITSLSGETDWEVLRDGEPYDSASADGELLVITTPPLGARPETYVVQASAQGCGCGTGRGGGWLLGLLALPLWLRRRLP